MKIKPKIANSPAIFSFIPSLLKSSLATKKVIVPWIYYSFLEGSLRMKGLKNFLFTIIFRNINICYLIIFFEFVSYIKLLIGDLYKSSFKKFINFSISFFLLGKFINFLSFLKKSPRFN